MVFVSTKQKIYILIIVGYGDRTRTHQEACKLFNELYLDHQINRSTVIIDPHTSTPQLSGNLDMSHTLVHKVLKVKKLHPYKVQLIHELNQDDFYRQIQFCEEMMLRCVQNPLFKTLKQR